MLDLLSHVVTAPVFAPEMMAMIGLGVGIDYALFIVTRYRQGLAEGRDPREAVAVSLATSGRAVVFAGTTVILSLLGLFILQLPFMRGLAVGAIAAVVLVMLAAITLLPAMLGFVGPGHRQAPRTRVCCRAGPSPTPGASGTGGAAPSSATRRWPGPRSGGAGLPGLALLLDAPGLHRRRQRPALLHHPSGLRRCWPTGFGPGFNGPLVRGRHGSRRRTGRPSST